MNKKMYNKPETSTVPVEMGNTVLSASQTVGIGDGQGSGAALAPGRQEGEPKF